MCLVFFSYDLLGDQRNVGNDGRKPLTSMFPSTFQVRAECRPRWPLRSWATQSLGGPVCYGDTTSLAPPHTDIGEINASWSRLKLWYANANTMYHLFVLWSRWEVPTAPPPPLPFPLFHFSLPYSPPPLPQRLLAVGPKGKLGWSRHPSLSTACFLPTCFPLRLQSSQTFRSPRGKFLPSIFPFLAVFFISCVLALTLAMKNREVLT